MTILDEIAEETKKRVLKDKNIKDLDELKSECEKLYSSDKFKNGDNGRFYKALSKSGLSFICEIKKASPSKGIISPDFPYLDIANAYASAGADCVSCLTEPKWFLGSDDIFKEIRQNIDTPMLRKDFVVDEYQLYQAKLLGADAVLLIVAITSEDNLKKYMNICDELGLDVLVETHNEQEIDTAINIGARIIGVNNRNLKDFTVDFSNASNLKCKIPNDVIYVAESGVSCIEDITSVSEIGADAVLMGEVLMRSDDIPQTIKEMRFAAKNK